MGEPDRYALRTTHPTPCLPALLLAALFAAPLAAQDIVILRGKAGGETRVTGQILDYTGRELSIELPGGTTQRFPTEQVVQVQTHRTTEQIQGDEHFARGDFPAALTMYRAAIDSESRRWMRREILAQTVRCYDALGRPAEAGAFFLLLVDDDPGTQHFDCIPLGWVPGQPDAALEQAARNWFNSDRPAAVLLGASHLLSTSLRPQAVARLGELRGSADPRIAQLAEAQLWRALGVQSTPAQRAGWLRAIEAMPEPMPAGPYFTLGLAQLQAGEHEQAALSLLRVAVVYPRHRALAARAALEAARAMEQSGRTEYAARLYQEIVRDYKDQTRIVAEAEARMQP
ncbi:MAG: tetratricopeptide repeat protein [Thermoguttaceae bacterium]|nr:tetratricopeptide repeat protein [Thermoguttaceae bacterium]